MQMFYLDIVDLCQLQCPYCPSGMRMMDRGEPPMSFELFTAIVDKIKREATDDPIIGLYNWGEPFLHPQIADLTGYLNRQKIPFTLSTNLSYKNLEGVFNTLKNKPYTMAVSLSGFTQETYRRTHTTGDIELVKNNLRKIAEFKKQNHIETYIAIKWLCYKSNQHEKKLMMQLAEEIGLAFEEYDAGIIDMNQLFNHFEKGKPLSVDPENLFDHMIPSLPNKETEAQRLATKCLYQYRETVIRANGKVYQCCVLPYREEYCLGNFLEHPLSFFKNRQVAHPACITCKKYNLHAVLNEK